MEAELVYGRERFGRALGLLDGTDPTLMHGFADTPRNRLRRAVLEVYPCVLHHLPSRSSYESFAQLMVDLRECDPNGRILSAIDVLTDREVDEFTRRLASLARVVAAKLLPSERLRLRAPAPSLPTGEPWLSMRTAIACVVLDPLTYRELRESRLPAGTSLENPTLALTVAEKHDLRQVTLRGRLADGSVQVVRVAVADLRAGIGHSSQQRDPGDERRATAG